MAPVAVGSSLRPVAALVAALVWMGGCSMPGRPRAGEETPRPEAVLDAKALYNGNCSGCHGAEGKLGPATSLSNPEYQALVDDDTLRSVIAHGQPGSVMPAFSGRMPGSLTDAQIEALVRGMRAWWSRGNVLAGAGAPPYHAPSPGDAHAGQAVYATHCSFCHGDLGGDEGDAGSILNGSFLALMPPQSIRTTVIVGRPDLGMPDWRKEIPGQPLNAADVTNVVAFLQSQKVERPGQPYGAKPAADANGGAAEQQGIQAPQPGAGKGKQGGK